AGHYVIADPIYLCPRQDLWITRADAPPLEDVLNKAGGEQVHIVPTRIFLAQWTSDENGKPFARVVIKDGGGNYQWVDGPERRSGWPEKLRPVAPLLGGSVRQVFRDDLAGPVKLALSTLSDTSIDEKKIDALVDQLSDEDPAKRTAAFNELTRYGPASWPVLEKLLNDQPPEARIRLETLLASKSEPTLGGRKPGDG